MILCIMCVCIWFGDKFRCYAIFIITLVVVVVPLIFLWLCVLDSYVLSLCVIASHFIDIFRALLVCCKKLPRKIFFFTKKIECLVRWWKCVLDLPLLSSSSLPHTHTHNTSLITVTHFNHYPTSIICSTRIFFIFNGSASGSLRIRITFTQLIHFHFDLVITRRNRHIITAHHYVINTNLIRTTEWRRRRTRTFKKQNKKNLCNSITHSNSKLIKRNSFSSILW